MPKVSVIMGIYNCEATLADAIESVLNQTFQDFEFIICNDGSTDHTFDIAKKFKSMVPEKIVLIENPDNMGLNYTLNHCLSVAKGQYIARMDGDDRSLPERFEREVQFLDENPEYALVSTWLEAFDDDGVWGIHSFKDSPTPEDLVRGSCFSHSACMIRKEVFDEVGGYSVGKKFLRIEDKHLWYKIYAAGYKGKNLSEILYSYRDDRNGYTKRKLKYRLNSAYVTSLTIKTFKLPAYFYLCAFKTIIIGMLPYGLYMKLHKWKLNRN